jgi:hypothetical protein
VVALHLADGSQRQGVIRAVAGGWLHLLGSSGAMLINLSQAAVIDLGVAAQAVPAPIDDPRPRPVSSDIPKKLSSRAPGRPWLDGDLTALADGFLDGRSDAELSESCHRTSGQIKQLRQGFECTRGTVAEEDISPVAATWIARWRRVLAGGR